MTTEAIPPIHVIRDRLYDLKQMLVYTASTNPMPKFNIKLYGLVVGKIDKEVGPIKRHEFYAAVFGVTHSAQMSPSQKYAVLMWAKPAALDVQPMDEKTVWTFDGQFLTDLKILKVTTIK